MHELISCSVYVCASALLLPLVHVSLFPLYLRLCTSHPGRALHLYLSETSMEIDSSDGMISEASTKDPSSSESEGPSSDEEEDDDDDDWGCGEKQCDRNTSTIQEARWLDSQMAPMDYVPWFCWLENRWRERFCGVKNEPIVQEWKENGKKVLFVSFWIKTKRLQR